MTETRNATIAGTHLGIEDHGLFTVNVDFDFGGGLHQGTGHYSGDAWPGFVRGIIETVGVDRWEQLPGTLCRIQHGPDSMIHRVGHILNDTWFEVRT